MPKIKERFNFLYQKIKDSIKTFPLTIGTILILTLIYSINLQNIKSLNLFGIIFSCSCFLVETLCTGKSKKRIFFYILSALLSFTFTYILEINNEFLIFKNDIFINYVSKILFCYLISIITLSVYFNFKNSKNSFEEYTVNCFIGYLKTGLIYFVLSVGIAIISAIFIFLILNGNGYDLILKLEVLLFGFYFLPTIIYLLYNPTNDINKFFKILIKYILGILLILAFLIIYIYILKILIFRTIPSNEIFRILSSLFIVGLPIWTMIGSFNEHNFLDKINSKLPLLFAPFVLLQIYSIGTRIASYGLTVSRYLCVMLILFEIIYIVMYLVNKNKIERFLFVFIFLSIISLVVPFVNMYDLSNISQYNILKTFDKSFEYSSNDKQKFYGAYCYLNSSKEGKIYLDKLDSDILQVIKQFGIIPSSYSDINNLYATSNSKFIDVYEYKYLYIVNKEQFHVSRTIDEVFGNLSLEIDNINNPVTVNISSEINDYINNDKNISSYFKINNEIQLDENTKLVLKSISISYNKNSKEVLFYDLSGYLLIK